MLKFLQGLKTWMIILLLMFILVAINAVGGIIPGVDDNWLWEIFLNQFMDIVRTFWVVILLAITALVLIKSETARNAVMGIAVSNPKAALIAGGIIVAIITLAIAWQPLIGFLDGLPWMWILVFAPPILSIIVVILSEMGYMNLQGEKNDWHV